MPDLTNRELSVAKAVCEGLPNKCIANKLGISVPTAKKHVSAIIAKLGVGSRSDIVRYYSVKGGLAIKIEDIARDVETEGLAGICR